MIYFNEEDIKSVKLDFESGEFTQRQLAQKYGISQTKLRSVLGLGKQTQADQQNNTRAIIKSRKQRNRELVQKVTVEVVDSFVKKEFVDVMQGIRDGLNDLIELNQEQRMAIPEMTNNLKRLLRKVEETADPITDKELVKAIYKTLTEISSFCQGS